MSGRGSCREGENQPKGEKGVIDSKAGEAESSKLSDIRMELQGLKFPAGFQFCFGLEFPAILLFPPFWASNVNSDSLLEVCNFLHMLQV